MIKIFCLLISILNMAYATENSMSQLVLKKALLDQSEIISKPHMCHESPPDQSLAEVGDQGFLATITCHFGCKGSEAHDHEIKENFQTKDLAMSRGDGALWAGLTTTLRLWSGEICMKVAQQNCGSLEKITSFKTPTLSSGKWKWNKKLSCDKSETSVVSPFDQTMKTEKVSFVKTNNLTDLEIKTSWLKPKKEISHNSAKYIMPKNCKKQISGTFCFGDCVALDSGPLKELLSGPEPLGSDTYTLCADNLVKKIGKKKLAREVVDFYCEDYFISTLKDINAGGFSCAAARAVVDCSQLK
jgi:hypothetical protein